MRTQVNATPLLPNDIWHKSALTFLLLFLLAANTVAYAGLMEVSTSFGVRSSSIDENNYNKNESWTGSFAWYFLEMSAIEISYTKGVSEQSLKSDASTPALVYFSKFEMYGADLVVTFAKKNSALQPFVRGGMAKIKKNIYRKDTSNGQIDNYGEAVDDVVPSYGFGIKLMLTETFSIKGSYDRWRSGSSQDKDIWDDAIKAGVSLYF